MDQFKHDFNYSYSGSNFNRLPQAVAKKNRLSHKVSDASKIIDSVINLFSPNYVSSNFYICDHSIVTFRIKGKCIELSSTSRVDSLDRFRISVLDKVKTDIFILH